MTIVESIKCVLQQNNDGLTSKQIYDEIIRQGLYSFGAENPVGVVNAQLRRRCIGLDFPTAYPIKFFEIAGYEGKKIKFRLISTENTATTITAPKTTDTVVDFVIEDSEENDNNADADRAEWLTDLSQTRRCEHEK